MIDGSTKIFRGDGSPLQYRPDCASKLVGTFRPALGPGSNRALIIRIWETRSGGFIADTNDSSLKDLQIAGSSPSEVFSALVNRLTARDCLGD